MYKVARRGAVSMPKARRSFHVRTTACYYDAAVPTVCLPGSRTLLGAVRSKPHLIDNTTHSDTNSL